MAWRCACLALGLVFLLTGVAQAAGGSPAAVSPGSVKGFSSISGRCPTFSWGQVKEARSYELVVYQVASGDEVAFGSGEPPVINQQFPGTAQSWTPALGQCLATGGSYAWSIRAVTNRGATSWSLASLFRVSSAPSLAEVEEALGVLRMYMADGGDRSGAPADVGAMVSSDEGTPRARSVPSRVDREVESADPPVDPAVKRDLLRQLVAESRAQREPRPKALQSNSSGLTGEAGGTPPPSSYALVTDGATSLGGAVFKDGAAFLHNTGSFNVGVGLQALESNTTAFAGTAVGQAALRNNTTGLYNTGVGTEALMLNVDGDHNTGLGRGALKATTASDNTAVGSAAMRFNVGGGDNTAIGQAALTSNTSGSGNTAVGARALEDNTGSYNTAVGQGALFNITTGEYNIGVGPFAGVLATAGSDNIFIGHAGDSGDSGVIRIGQVGVQTTASIGGDVGIGTEAPLTRLDVRGSVSGFGGEDHVALIENTTSNLHGSGLAVSLTREAFPGTTNDFISFLMLSSRFSAGSIRGNGSGGVELASSGGDYAEWLEKSDPSEDIARGDVVGVFGKAVSKNTEGANGFMVVSSGAIVAGNDPGGKDRHRYALIAFVGQADVRIDTRVRRGDYLVPSGKFDGKAIAIRPEDLDIRLLRAIIGRALEDRSPEDPGTVRTMVGVADPGPLAVILAQQAKTIEAQQRELTQQRLELADLRREIETSQALVAKR